VAKTRAQRKAERRKRQQEAERQGQADGGTNERAAEERAQEDTQRGVSGEVAEAEAVIQTGAHTEDYGEHTVDPEVRDEVEGQGSPVPGVVPAPVEPETELEPPAPSRADVGVPEDGVVEAPPVPETREQRRDRKKREKEQRRRARQKEQKKGGATAEKPEKRRGPVIGFIASCWAELKRVQWPDRDTLVQASAVTFIFVAVMAAYLGGLDAAFNWLIKQII
jgi:preprotein translocase SecE subunit